MTQLDQARAVARDLYRHLEMVDPRTAQTLGERYRLALNVTWLTPRRDLTDPAGWLTREQVAEAASVSPAAVSMWGSRGIRRGGITVKLTRHPEGYDEQESHDFIALLRRSPAPKDEET